jgi:hypothetical protein
VIKKRHYISGVKKIETSSGMDMQGSSDVSLKEDLVFVAKIMNRNRGVISHKDNKMIMELLKNN